MVCCRNCKKLSVARDGAEKVGLYQTVKMLYEIQRNLKFTWRPMLLEMGDMYLQGYPGVCLEECKCS